MQCTTQHTAVTIKLVLQKLKEILRLQKIVWYFINNLTLIKWTRLNDHSETDSKAPDIISHNDIENPFKFYSQLSIVQRFDTGDLWGSFWAFNP